MNCVRCGDPQQYHCKADGSNVRNAACAAFLEKWEEPAPDPLPEPPPPPKKGK
jgi:hypothetical protein